MDEIIEFMDNPSLCDKVYDYLKDQIMSGRLAPGTRLPEAELASRLRVSRAPVREALNMLSKDGFVVRKPRHGAVVSPVTMKEVSENWDLRALIEPYAAKVACEYIPKDELLAVRQLILDTVDAENYDLYLDSDYKTHSIIYQYVQNSQLRDLLTSTMLSSMRYRYFSENSHPTSAQIIKDVCHEHILIVDALIDGDAERASQTMLEHIRAGYARIQNQLSE